MVCDELADAFQHDLLVFEDLFGLFWAMQGGVVEEASECICHGVRLSLKFHSLTEKIWKTPWQLLTWPNMSSISSTGAGNSFSSLED